MAAKRMNAHLKQRDLKELEDVILAEMERIKNKLETEQLMQISDNNGRDDIDAATENILNQSQLRFATREKLYLKKLSKTLKFMKTEEYGICEDCGANITFQRLKARPTSSLCINCKEESERDELQSVQGSKSTSLSKAFSL